jgi:hypothetical protein
MSRTSSVPQTSSAVDLFNYVRNQQVTLDHHTASTNPTASADSADSNAFSLDCPREAHA